MSGHYRNFKTVVYIPAAIADRMTPEKLEYDYDFIEKYIGLDKVYLETHRDRLDVDSEKILAIKSFLEGKGVEVSGGITTTIDDFEGAETGKRRLFNTFCYTDPAMRARLKEISENVAKLFDEFILDDFYFTNCTCERCIKEKGDRDWVTFRRELMRDVSQNLIVGPAKAVNPKVKVVIKYPNWRESYHFTGYVPEVQKDIFDATYTGTETRNPMYTDQHLPEYLSYSLMRYMDNAWPGGNGGGWFDTYQCWSVDRYLEQAYLTGFAKAKELMHFMWSDLIDNPLVGSMGIQLKKIDKMMEGIGKPVGIPTYIPLASSGENHLEMRLGMVGLPIEATPVFPEGGKKVLLTESSLADENIIDKLVSFVKNGGDAVITTGFFEKAGDRLREEGLTEARLTGRKLGVNRYQITGDWAGYIDDKEEILFPEIVHGNNASWSLLNGGNGDYHFSLFLRSAYGKGRLYIMSVPENDADIYRLPGEVIEVYGRALCENVYGTGHNFSVFAYDDNSVIVYKYVKENNHPEKVTLHLKTEAKEIVNESNGMKYEVRKTAGFEDFEKYEEYVADVYIEPGRFEKLKIV